LRSSAAADGGRCPGVTDVPATVLVLRSSAAADGGRCRWTLHSLDPLHIVAILGRRGRRPLHMVTSARNAASTSVAILGRRGRRPLRGTARHQYGAQGVAILGRRGRRPLLPEQ